MMVPNYTYKAPKLRIMIMPTLSVLFSCNLHTFESGTIRVTKSENVLMAAEVESAAFRLMQ